MTKEKRQQVMKILSGLRQSRKDKTEKTQIGDESVSLTSQLLNDELKSINESVNEKLRETAAFKALEKIDAEVLKLRQELDPRPIMDAIDEIEKTFQQDKEELISQIESVIENVEYRLSEATGGVSKEMNSKISSVIDDIRDIRAKFDVESGRSDTKESKINVEITKIKNALGDISNVLDGNSKSWSNLSRLIEKKSSELKSLEREFESTRTDLVNKISSLSSTGGGSMNRQIKVGGTDVLTKYTDINLVAGSGVSISTAADDTDRNTDITITAVGLAPQTPTGEVNGVNTSFVFGTAPNLICVDQGRFMQKTSSDGTVNWTGTTTVTLTVAPTFDIFGL